MIEIMKDLNTPDTTSMWPCFDDLGFFDGKVWFVANTGNYYRREYWIRNHLHEDIEHGFIDWDKVTKKWLPRQKTG